MRRVLLAIPTLVLWSTMLPAADDGPLSRVRYTTARDHNVQKQIDLPGTVEAPKSSQVASEVEGLVAKIHAREGQYVKRGAPLVSLRAEHLEIELQASTAQKREADARLALAERNLTRSQGSRSTIRKSESSPIAAVPRSSGFRTASSALRSAHSSTARRRAITSWTAEKSTSGSCRTSVTPAPTARIVSVSYR